MKVSSVTFKKKLIEYERMFAAIALSKLTGSFL